MITGFTVVVSGTTKGGAGLALQCMREGNAFDRTCGDWGLLEGRLQCILQRADGCKGAHVSLALGGLACFLSR